MLRVFGIGIIYCMILIQNAFCSEEDWKLLKQKSDELCKGIDLKVSLSMTNENDGETNPGGKINFEIPLFSREERENKRLAKVTFLKEGAQIIKEIEEAEETLKVKNEEANVLKKTLMSEGTDGIGKYFVLKVEMVKITSLLRQKRREFEALCGKK